MQCDNKCNIYVKDLICRHTETIFTWRICAYAFIIYIFLTNFVLMLCLYNVHETWIYMKKDKTRCFIYNCNKQEIVLMPDKHRNIVVHLHRLTLSAARVENHFCKDHFAKLVYSRRQDIIWIIKPNALDICRHISAADADTQIQFVNHSAVKFVCVRIPRVVTWVRYWSVRRKIVYGYLIGPYPMFNRHRTANPYSNLYADASGAPNGVRWLACVSSSLCMQQPYYMYGSSYCLCISCVRMLRCNSDGHIELETVWSMNPSLCSLAHWILILRIRQHIVWDESRGPT